MDHKQVARTFLQWAASGRVKEAYDQFVAPSFKHHNAYFAADTNALREGMEQAARDEPNKELDVKRVIKDGDLVAVHSRLKRADPKRPEIAVVHIMRFEGDRIAELWDVAQELPKDSPNTNGAF